MTLSFRSAGTVFTTGSSGGVTTTFTAHVPTGTGNVPQANDLLLAIGVDWSGSGVTWVTPTGWTLVQNTNDASSQNVGVHVYRKLATGSDTDQNFTLGSAEAGLMVMLCYTGNDTTSPIDVSGGTGTDSITAIKNPSVTTTVANDTLVLIYGVGSDPTAVSALSTPTGATLRVAMNHTAVTAADTALMVADITQSAAGASAQYTSTLTGSSGTYGTVGMVVAVKPSSAGSNALAATIAGTSTVTAALTNISNGGALSATVGGTASLAPNLLQTNILQAAIAGTSVFAPTFVPPDVSKTILTSSALGPVTGATGGSNQNHLIYAKNTGRWWFFTFGTTIVSGTATGGTTQTLVDSSKTFTTAVDGRTVVITSGTGAGNAFEATHTSATTLRIQNNGDPATPAVLNFTPDSTTHYSVIETKHINAYVSSSSDLSTATWSLATGGQSNETINGVGVDVAGGRWDGGYFGGTYPTDGRQLTMAYASISGNDVVYAMAQTGIHWTKIAARARITAADTIAWDAMAANTNTWDDTFGDQEALPYPYQGIAMAWDSNNGRWHTNWCKTQGMAGSAWTSADNGTLTTAPTWGGYVQTNTWDSTTDNNSGTHFPYQCYLAETSSGKMLSVYDNGNKPTTPGSVTNATQTGLRYVVSSSATAWPTTNTSGAAVPGLSTASNSANDWGMVQRTTSDTHVVRRNSATTFEHVRWNGTAWSSVTTLPTSGLTGHLSNSGVALSTDGTDVWCFVVDTDQFNTVRAIRWNGSSGLWDAAWVSASTNANSKQFLTTSSQVASGGPYGLVWSEGSSPTQSVRTASFTPPPNIVPLACNINGIGAATPTLTQLQIFAAAINGVSTVADSLSQANVLTGVLAGLGSLSASLPQNNICVCSIAGTSSVASNLHQSNVLLSSMAGLSAFTSNVVQSNNCACTIAGVGSLAANLNQANVLLASIVTSSLLTPNFAGFNTLAATIAGIAALSGNLSQANKLTSAILGASSFAGLLTLTYSLSCTLAGSSTLTASLTQAAALAAVLAGVSSLTAPFPVAGVNNLVAVLAGLGGFSTSLMFSTHSTCVTLGAMRLVQFSISGKSANRVNLAGVALCSVSLSGKVC